MKHPNALALEAFYSHFSKSDFQSAVAACSEKLTFQIAGKSKLAGKFTQANFISDFAMKLGELSGGTFKFEVHDILASDLHGTVLASAKVTRKGETIEYRTVHVWRFDGSKPMAGYEYPRDLYQYDAIWS